MPNNVWILTWGTWGDHEPAAALALGLKAAGHSVTVFGSFRYHHRFVDLGVEFTALDSFPVLHPGNSEARRLLQAQAIDAGFEGPGALEEHFFNLGMEWLDFIERLGITGDAAVADEITAYRGFLLFGQGLESMPEQSKKRKYFLAKRVGKSVKEYEAWARKQRSAVWQLFERVANETSMSPLDATLSWRSTCLAKMIEAVSAEPDERKLQKLTDMTNSLHEWEGNTDLEKALDEHWKRWSPQFSHPNSWSDGMRDLTASNLLALQNVRYELQGSAPPDLVVCHQNLPSAAAHLEGRGIRTAPWWSIIPCPSQSLIGYFTYHLGLEQQVPGDKPLARIGPLRFVDMWHGKRNLISMSALSLRACQDCGQHLLPYFTGKWVLDGEGPTGGTLSQEVKAFLTKHSDEPPVYFGWGSMPSQPSGLASLVVRTLRKLGRPGIFVVGFSGVSRAALKQAFDEEYQDEPELLLEVADRLLYVESAPHELLLPRVACAVHHGGLGTCHAALRAGVPSVVVPVGADQFQNSDLLDGLGCALKGPWLLGASPEALAPLVGRVLQEPAFLAKAQELRDLVLQEAGVATAVERLQTFLQEEPPACALTPPAPGLEEEAPACSLTPAAPELEGEYEAQASFGDFKPDLPLFTIRSDTGLYGQLGDFPFFMGQVQGGNFSVGDEVQDTLPGEYSVRMSWADRVWYGHVRPDTISDRVCLEFQLGQAQVHGHVQGQGLLSFVSLCRRRRRAG